jgi:hypothetical protein
MHTPGAAGGTAAATMLLTRPGPSGPGRQDRVVSELIVAVSPVTAQHLAGQSFPPRCSRVRVTYPATTAGPQFSFSQGTLTASIQPVAVPMVGQQTWAYRLTPSTSVLGSQVTNWVEGFRIRNYLIEVRSYYPTRYPYLPVLEQAASQAYQQAADTLP